MPTIQDKIKPGKITIDKLGEMINNGFEESNKNLHYEIGCLEDRLGNRIDGLDKRIDGLDQKIDFRFNGLQNRMDNTNIHYLTIGEHNLLKVRVEKVEKKVFSKR